MILMCIQKNKIPHYISYYTDFKRVIISNHIRKKNMLSLLEYSCKFGLKTYPMDIYI